MINQNKGRDFDEKSINSFQTLISITNAIQLECEGYAMLGEYEAGKECLRQFKEFIIDNKLNERDILILLNENLKQKQINVVNDFSSIADGISEFDATKKIESHINDVLIEREVGVNENVSEE